MQRPSFLTTTVVIVSLWGISPPFGRLFPSRRQVTYALLTRSPLYSLPRKVGFSHDLHVLGTPLAFTLSQDQTLR